MPWFKIAGSYGLAGSDWSDEVEADCLEEAEEIARDRALERVEYWAEPMPAAKAGEDGR